MSNTMRDDKPSAVQIEGEPSDEKPNLGDYSGATAKTSIAEIALVRKLDMRIMPALFCMYFLNKLDQNALANAKLNSLEKDLKLKGTQYNTAISILYVGYLFMQIPSNMLLSSRKVRPSVYMAVTMMLWAVVAAVTGAVRNYAGLVLVRFFLGAVEAPFYPGALYILSSFYTRKEIATRVSILYAGNIIAVAFAGLIAAATFSTLDGAHGLAGWRWLFIIEGVVTFVVAFVTIFLLPDYPNNTRWLTAEERELAHGRILRDTVGREDSKGVRAGLIEALKDPRLYLFALMQNMHLNATSFNQFFPSVVKALGYTPVITLVLTSPPTLFAGAFGILIGWSSGRFNERTWHVTGCMGAAMIGFIINCFTLNIAARYIACFLFASGVYSCNSVILGWVSATLGQTPEKKAISLYSNTDAPKYVTAMSANACFSFLSIACAWGMKVWLFRMNKELKQQNPANAVFYAY